MFKNIITSQEGAVSILLAILILVTVFSIGITVTNARIIRSQLTNQQSDVIRADELVISTKDHILQDINSPGGSISNFYIPSGLGDCFVPNWETAFNVVGGEYCIVDTGVIQNPRYPGFLADVTVYVLKVRFQGRDIIRQVPIYIPL